MCDKATQSQQRTKNRKKCWEMTGEPDATAEASSSAGNKDSRPVPLKPYNSVGLEPMHQDSIPGKTQTRT